jgi:hypothetical protein
MHDSHNTCPLTHIAPRPLPHEDHAHNLCCPGIGSVHTRAHVALIDSTSIYHLLPAAEHIRPRVGGIGQEVDHLDRGRCVLLDEHALRARLRVVYLNAPQASH